MREVKQTTAAAVSVLDERIAKAVALQLEADRIAELLKSEREAIKSTLDGAGLDRYATKDGHEAVLIASEVFTWNAIALDAVLEGDDVDELIPRKPEGAKLRKRYDSDADFAKAVKGCFKRSHKTALEVRGATQIEAKAA